MNKLQLFVMWLDGYMEDKTSLNEEQTKKLANKLNNLFEHEADNVSAPTPETHTLDIEPNIEQPWDLRPGDDDVKYRC